MQILIYYISILQSYKGKYIKSFTKVIKHPSYEKKTLINDIGLVRTTRSMISSNNPNVATICLPLHKTQYPNDLQGKIAGWGSKFYGKLNLIILNHV